jgi:hypothetical protein
MEQFSLGLAICPDSHHSNEVAVIKMVEMQAVNM